MKTAKLFFSGGSQAIRLPKEYRFDESDVFIKKYDNLIIVFPKNDPWASLINSLEKFSADFMEDRNQPAQQKRESAL
jgi:antitoxin VapB